MEKGRSKGSTEALLYVTGFSVESADPRDQRIAELEAQVERLTQELQAAQARVRELEARIQHHFIGGGVGGGSRPKPATPITHPNKQPRRHRKRGGQPGHPGHHRSLLPLEQVTQIVPVKPPACARCAAPLVGDDPAPWRHQVIEVQPIQPHVTEYQISKLTCLKCGFTTRADLPPQGAGSPFGPRLCALVALCTGKYHLSKRQVEQMLQDVLGVRVALGSVCAMEQMVACALTQPMAQAQQAVKVAQVVYQDETPWRQSNGKAWLWVAVTAAVTLFQIARSRGAKVSKQMLGLHFVGKLVSDRWRSYCWVGVLRRQVCWAHLIRDFQELVDRGGDDARLGTMLLEPVRKMFRWWHRVRDGTLSREAFQKKMRPLRKQVNELLVEGARWFSDKAKGLCKDLLRQEPTLWRFIDEEGIEPTNNAAEQALRQAVLWRKGSFGTQSERGSQFAERILTVVTTLRQQDRCVLEFLTEACSAHLHQQPSPSLLPVAS